MINKLHLAMIELYRGDAKRIQHFCKVHSYAKLIAETENVDKKCLFTIEAAALTHDIGIHFCEEKYGNCNGKLQEQEGPAIAERLLEKLGFEKDISERVQYLIAHHIHIIILMKLIIRYWWRLIFWLILWRMAYRKKQL